MQKVQQPHDGAGRIKAAGNLAGKKKKKMLYDIKVECLLKHPQKPEWK